MSSRIFYCKVIKLFPWFGKTNLCKASIFTNSNVRQLTTVHLFLSIILEEIFKAGNIDRKILPSDFYQRSPIEQVRLFSRSFLMEETL